METQVLIVGAGPVGLLAAIALAQENIDVVVIEAASNTSDAPRAIVYFGATLHAFDKLGVLDAISDISLRVDKFGFRIPEFNFKADLDYAILRGSSYDFHLHCSQGAVVGALKAHAERAGAKVLFGHALTHIEQHQDHVIASVSTPAGEKAFRADWLIGSDGARSTTRKLLALGFDGFTWSNRFVATDLYCDFGKYGYGDANTVWDPSTGGVILRINQDNLWRVTYQEDASLPVDRYLERLPAKYAEILPAGEPYELVASGPYAIHQRSASTYRVGRCLLAGDAAHATNPLGGLGLTGGVWDAVTLADILASVIHRETKDAVLDLWSVERRRVFLELSSPRASENKRVAEEADLAKRRKNMEALDVAASNPDIARTMLLFPYQLVGKTLREGSRWANSDVTARVVETLMH